MEFKGQIGLQFGGELKNGWEKEMRRGRGRRRGEEKGGIKSKKVWKLTLIMNSMRFDMDPWFCRVCMTNNLLKPRVLLGFHLIPKIMESKVGKTLNSTRRS